MKRERMSKKTQFKPGISGNPNGRPRLPEELKAARKLTRVQLEILINRYLSMSAAEMMVVAEDPCTPVLDLMIASIIKRAVVNGDQLRLDFILNRIVGKVIDNVEISYPKPTVIKRRDGSEVELGSELEKLEEGDEEE